MDSEYEESALSGAVEGQSVGGTENDNGGEEYDDEHLEGAVGHGAGPPNPANNRQQIPQQLGTQIDELLVALELWTSLSPGSSYTQFVPRHVEGQPPVQLDPGKESVILLTGGAMNHAQSYMTGVIRSLTHGTPYQIGFKGQGGHINSLESTLLRYSGFMAHQSMKKQDLIGTFFCNLMSTLSESYDKQLLRANNYFMYPLIITFPGGTKTANQFPGFVGYRKVSGNIGVAFDRDAVNYPFKEDIGIIQEQFAHKDFKGFTGFKLTLGDDYAIVLPEYQLDTDVSTLCGAFYPKKERSILRSKYYNFIAKSGFGAIQHEKPDCLAAAVYYVEPIMKLFRLDSVSTNERPKYIIALAIGLRDVFLQTLGKPPAERLNIDLTNVIQQIGQESHYLTRIGQEGYAHMLVLQQENTARQEYVVGVKPANKVYPTTTWKIPANDQNNGGQGAGSGAGYGAPPPGQGNYPNQGYQNNNNNNNQDNGYNNNNNNNNNGGGGKKKKGGKKGKGGGKKTMRGNARVNSMDPAEVNAQVAKIKVNQKLRGEILEDVAKNKLPKAQANKLLGAMNSGSKIPGLYVSQTKSALQGAQKALNKKRVSMGYAVQKSGYVQAKLAMQKYAQEKFAQNQSFTECILFWNFSNALMSNTLAHAESHRVVYPLINPWGNNKYLMEFHKQIVEDGIRKTIMTTGYGWTIPAIPEACVSEAVTDDNWLPLFGTFVNKKMKATIPERFKGDLLKPMKDWAFWPVFTKLWVDTNHRDIRFILHRQLSQVFTDASGTHFKTLPTFAPTYSYRLDSRRTIADMDRNIKSGEPCPFSLHAKVTLMKKNTERNMYLETEFCDRNDGNFHLFSNAVVQIWPNQDLLKQYAKHNRAYIDTIALNFTTKAYMNVIHVSNGVNVGKIFSAWVAKTKADRAVVIAKAKVREQLHKSVKGEARNKDMRYYFGIGKTGGSKRGKNAAVLNAVGGWGSGVAIGVGA